MRILVKNGTIVTSTEEYNSDIYISDGRITRIEPEIPFSYDDKVIDATGYYVFPGGIDPHVHMHLPSPAGYSSDDFYTGSRAALFGGTTTLLDFVTPEKGQSLSEALRLRKKEARDSFTDYSFHVSPVEWRETTEQEVQECIREGITSFKVYMAYKDTIGLNDDDLFKVMKMVGQAGKLVTIHCESGDEIEKLRNRYFEERHFEPEYHALSRPASLEAYAVKKAIDMANRANCSLYIVHVSAKESLEYIIEAQERGQKVYSETCPQYLFLDDSKYKGVFSETAQFIISPPLRKKEDNEALWNAISKDTISTIGTDHCPFNFQQKARGRDDFRKIPGGAGGVEFRLGLLYTYGVLSNRITINRMVDLFSTQPAKIFGMYPAKGDILVGSDADLVIWNPGSERIISAKTHHQNCDLNIFEGIKTKGNAFFVIAGGNIVVEKGKLTEPETRGKFIKR
jgi:dihydropyrimidinase